MGICPMAIFARWGFGLPDGEQVCLMGNWNSLPIEYFPLTYDLSDFTSIINRQLLTVGYF